MYEGTDKAAQVVRVSAKDRFTPPVRTTYGSYCVGAFSNRMLFVWDKINIHSLADDTSRESV